MAGDLHTHSTCSDGSVPIHRLPLMAARLGLSALALSDHDTTLSAQYAYDHPVQDGVRLIPAAELTGYSFLTFCYQKLNPLCKQIAHLAASNQCTPLGHNISGAVALCQNLANRFFHCFCLFIQIKCVTQHHGSAQHSCNGICEIFARDIRRTAVTGLI